LALGTLLLFKINSREILSKYLPIGSEVSSYQCDKRKDRDPKLSKIT